MEILDSCLKEAVKVEIKQIYLFRFDQMQISK